MNSSGLHARPAAKLVKVASEFSSDITVEHKGKTVNAKSIIEMMVLGANQGEEITIRVSGEDEQAAIEAMTQFVGEEHDKE